MIPYFFPPLPAPLDEYTAELREHTIRRVRHRCVDTLLNHIPYKQFIHATGYGEYLDQVEEV